MISNDPHVTFGIWEEQFDELTTVCMQTRLTSETSRPDRNSMFLFHFKINAPLQDRPMIQVRSLSFPIDSNINHWTRTHIIACATSLKGLAWRFGSASEAHLLNLPWTPEQHNLSYLRKQMRKSTNWALFLDFGRLAFIRSSDCAHRPNGKSQNKFAWKKKVKFELGEVGRLISDLHCATPPPVWTAFVDGLLFQFPWL